MGRRMYHAFYAPMNATNRIDISTVFQNANLNNYRQLFDRFEHVYCTGMSYNLKVNRVFYAKSGLTPNVSDNSVQPVIVDTNSINVNRSKIRTYWDYDRNATEIGPAVIYVLPRSKMLSLGQSVSKFLKFKPLKILCKNFAGNDVLTSNWPKVLYSNGIGPSWNNNTIMVQNATDESQKVIIPYCRSLGSSVILTPELPLVIPLNHYICYEFDITCKLYFKFTALEDKMDQIKVETTQPNSQYVLIPPLDFQPPFKSDVTEFEMIQ